MMKRMVIALLPALLAACATPAMVGPDGKVAYAVECEDTERNCEKKAAEFCPQGHVVTSKHSRAIVAWRGFNTVNTIKYTMTVECRE